MSGEIRLIFSFEFLYLFLLVKDGPPLGFICFFILSICSLIRNILSFGDFSFFSLQRLMIMPKTKQTARKTMRAIELIPRFLTHLLMNFATFFCLFFIVFLLVKENEILSTKRLSFVFHFIHFAPNTIKFAFGKKIKFFY